MLVPDLILSVSMDLNDQEPGNEYIHWPYEQLRHYLFEAMQQICQVAHKLFTERKIVTVQGGAVWQRACCECDQIIRVIGETDANGNLLHTLRRIQDNPDNAWPVSIPDLCPVTDETYEMEGYSISNIDDTYFQVIPAVPAGSTRYVMLECFVGVHEITDNYNVLWRFVAMVKMWMLARAYMMDSENTQGVFQLGERYMALWAQMFQALSAEMDKEEKEKTIGNDSVGAVSDSKA